MATGTGRPEDKDAGVESSPKRSRIVKRPKPLRRLGIPGTLDHAFYMVGGRETAIAMTRMGAHRDEQLEEIIKLYDDLNIGERAEPGLLERLCLAVGMHPAEYFGRVAGVAYRHNFDVAAFTAAVAAPLAVKAAAQHMQTKDGFKDRELILKAAKVLESAPLVSVTQNNQSATVIQGLPKLEELTGKVSDLIRAPEEQQKLLVEGEIVEEQEEELPHGFKVRGDEELEFARQN